MNTEYRRKKVLYEYQNIGRERTCQHFLVVFTLKGLQTLLLFPKDPQNKLF